MSGCPVESASRVRVAGWHWQVLEPGNTGFRQAVGSNVFESPIYCGISENLSAESEYPLDDAFFPVTVKRRR